MEGSRRGSSLPSTTSMLVRAFNVSITLNFNKHMNLSETHRFLKSKTQIVRTLNMSIEISDVNVTDVNNGSILRLIRIQSKYL